MVVRRLEMEDFRNYQYKVLELQGGITVVSGANGKGKTNLLEALHVAATGISFRTRGEDSLVRWGANSLALRLYGEGPYGSHYQALTWHHSEGRKVKVQEKEGKLLSALLGHVPVVAMTPGDIALVQGAPELRRRFLDSLLCQWRPQTLDILRRYNRILLQRNRWLRDAEQPGRGETLDVLSEQLSAWGAKFVVQRQALLRELAGPAAHIYGELSRGSEAFGLRLAYECEDSVENTQDYLQRELHSKRSAELARRTTLVGPHKDELFLELQGYSLREFGSQGQCRSAALALRLGASTVLQHQTKQAPLLLLDDIFAELDPHRRAAVGELVGQGGQVLCATPNACDLPFIGDAEILL